MSSMKRELISGVLYTSVARYAGMVIMLVVTGILARLFSPAEFGVVGIATVIISFFTFFSDLGLAPAIIQHKELSHHDLSNIFSLTVWSGVVVSVLFLLLAPLIATFYDGSQSLLIICRILSVNLLFAAVNIVPNALVMRDKRFRFAAVRSLVVQAVAGAVAIMAALCGVGIYALLINPILSSMALFVINFSEYPLRLRLRIQRESIGKVFSFSAYQFCFQIINYFSRNIDKLLMPKYMSMTDLGYYEKSYRLMLLPLQNISFIVTPVMHPIFAEMQHDLQRLSTAYLRVVRLLAIIGLPLSVVLCFTARELILLIFGGQWGASIPVFQILSLSVGIQILMSTSGSIFQAANATRMLFFCGVFSMTTTVAAICTGMFAFQTMEAIAWGICTAFAINFVQCYYALFCLTLHTSWWPFWRTLCAPLLLGLLLCLPLWGVTMLLNPQDLIISLVVKCGTALIVWLLYIQLTGIYDLRGKLSALWMRR